MGAKMEIKEVLNGLKDKQGTIGDLINLGQILVKVNGRRRLETENNISVNTVFESEEVSVTIATCPDEGAAYPEHCHSGIVEYLICLKGSFGVTLPHNGYRILKEKECAKIPANVMHSTISLEKDSDIIGICLPQETAYTSDKGE